MAASKRWEETDRGATVRNRHALLGACCFEVHVEKEILTLREKSNRFRECTTSTSWFTGSVMLFDSPFAEPPVQQPITSSKAAITTLAAATTYRISFSVLEKTLAGGRGGDING